MYNCTAELVNASYGPGSGGEYGPGSGGEYGPGSGGEYGPGSGGEYGPETCMVTEKKECMRPCMWCEPAYGGMAQCTSEMQARFLPAMVYDCHKGAKHHKKHDDDDDDKKQGVVCGMRACVFTVTSKQVQGMMDAITRLLGWQASPMTCGTAFREEDCAKGCYWCTMPMSPMGQCVGKDQKSLMPGATCTKAHTTPVA